MAVQRLQGWADEMAPAFENLGNALTKIINPNKEIQDELKKRIAANPQVLQQLIDQEKLNPGSVTSTFGSQISKILGGNMSSAGQVESATRDKMASDPNAVAEGVSRNITGKSIAGNQTERNQAKITSAEAGNADAKAAADAADYEEKVKLASTMSTMHEAQAKSLTVQAQKDQISNEAIVNNKGKVRGIKNLGALVKKAVDDPAKMSQDEQAQYQFATNDPETSKTVDAFRDSITKEKDIRLQGEMRKAAAGVVDKQLRAQAFSVGKSIGMPLATNEIMAMMTDPNANQRAQLMMAGKDPANPNKPLNMEGLTEQDKNLLKVADALQKDENQARNMQRSQVWSKIRTGIAAMKKDGADVPSLIAEINSNLQVVNPSLEYKFETDGGKFWYDKQGLANKGGDWISDDDAAKIVLKGEQTGQQQKYNSGDAVIDGYLNAPPADRAKGLEMLSKSSKPEDKQFLAKIKSEMAKAGVQ